MKPGPRPQPIIDRVFPRLEWRGDCLLWTGPTNNEGYGAITRRGGGTRLVHRIVLMHHAPIEAWEKALHSCDTPLCCNPEHLSAGTQAENMRQCIERGRFPTRKPLAACKQNHEFTPENTLMVGTVRHCRKCTARRQREYRRRRQERRTAVS